MIINNIVKVNLYQLFGNNIIVQIQGQEILFKHSRVPGNCACGPGCTSFRNTFTCTTGVGMVLLD